MRSFLCACAIFAAMTFGVGISKVYVENCLCRMSEAAAALPTAPEGHAQEIGAGVRTIRRLWDEHVFCISLTVPASRTDKIEQALNRLEAAWKAEDEALYRASAAELLSSLKKLMEAESFSLSGII